MGKPYTDDAGKLLATRLTAVEDMTAAAALKLLVDPKVVCLGMGCTSLAKANFQLLPLLEEIDLSQCSGLTALPEH